MQNLIKLGHTINHLIDTNNKDFNINVMMSRYATTNNFFLIRKVNNIKVVTLLVIVTLEGLTSEWISVIWSVCECYSLFDTIDWIIHNLQIYLCLAFLVNVRFPHILFHWNSHIVFSLHLNHPAKQSAPKNSYYLSTLIHMPHMIVPL